MHASSVSQGTLLSSGDESQRSLKSITSKSSSAVPSLDEKERDFTKDNASSPIDLECRIQEERITKILDEAIYKTKLAICLPEMVQNYHVLSSHLTSIHMEELIFIFEHYDNPLFSSSLLDVSVMEDIKSGDMSLKNRLNPELGHLLYIMNSYPALKPKVDDIIKKMKEDYLSNGGAKPSMEYLIALERFREIMIKQMQKTAAEELLEKLRIRKLEKSNKNLMARIEELTSTLQFEQTQYEETLKRKIETKLQLEKQLEQLHKASAVKLKMKVLESDRRMVVMSRAHAVKQELLKEEEADARYAYEQMLNRHLIDEKAQRARRFKVETQLMSWLQKYDTEMSDKQYELDELERMYDDEMKMCEELKAKIAEQEIEYLPLMKERDDEYQEELTKKMRTFLMEHSARVIQTAWRQVLANRAEKKKLKAKLKKMKADELKQERLQKLENARAKKKY